MVKKTRIQISSLPYPLPTSEAVSAVMRANIARDTGPELRLRYLLHSVGFRYRINYPIQCAERRVRPDIVFPRFKLAVFVDGCFWHMCPRHGTRPRSNRRYWSAKLRRNVERDAEVNAALREAGWKVLRVWEHTQPDSAAGRILRVLRRHA